ncbi:MAG TPA: histidine kinase [Actinomycetota bacterium]|nr:histidine kinase [Actinomycetota bacterium]
MNATARRRLPWVVWGVVVALSGVAITLTVLNGTRLWDIPIWVVMIFGYSTIGAILATRTEARLMAWLIMGIGLSVIVLGLSSEYAIYTFETNPGSLPFGRFAALMGGTWWIAVILGVLMLIHLYPTGRVPSPRWRFLPWTSVATGAVLVIAAAVDPRPLEELDVDARITSPFAVEGIEPLMDVVFAVWGVVVPALAVLSIASLILRYRRSRGDERQQIRWLAYVVATIAAVVLAWIAAGLAVGVPEGSTLDSIFFLIVLILVGVGLPTAMGVAILKYRLYDLDLVVKKTVLYATLAVLLTAVFLVVALVIGAIAGRSTTGAVVAAGMIGLLFWPALRLSGRLADRIVYGGRATPYEVLAEFSARVGSSYGDEDVLPRMVQILADAVSAERAVVWLRVGSELRPAAVRPDGQSPAPIVVTADHLPELDDDVAVEVRDRGELLGALAVTVPPNDPITPSKERLIRDLAAQAGLVLRNVRLIEELRASRQRLVAAQDLERRRIERNIHDGAQQQLVALSMKLRLAVSLVASDPSRAAAMLTELQDQATETLEDLRDLARGIYPPLLADRGLAAALAAQVRKAPVPAVLESDGIGRYPPDVEACVYFCVLEALQNVAKYANPTKVDVELRHEDGQLAFVVRDDGKGFDPSAAATGTGLQGMADRLDAIGGRFEITSAPGSGTSVSGRVPAAEREPA